jgi:hypothetical protein
MPPFHDLTSQIVVFNAEYLGANGPPTRVVERSQLMPDSLALGLLPKYAEFFRKLRRACGH